MKKPDHQSGIVIKKQSDVTIAGLPGSEIIAEAEWKDLLQAPATVYQVLLVDGKNYFIMQGFAPREEQPLPTKSGRGEDRRESTEQTEVVGRDFPTLFSVCSVLFRLFRTLSSCFQG